VEKQMCDEIECGVNKKGASHGLNPYETHRGRGWTMTIVLATVKARGDATLK
jgi:hypothetical protein